MRLLFLLLLCCGQALAAVPKPLQPWQDWVMDGQNWRQCPLAFGRQGDNQGDFQCLWLGSLTLALDDRQGQFSLPMERLDDGWVTLPGAPGDTWPQDLRLDGQPVAAVDRAGRPSLWLAKGRYQLQGRFHWPKLPQSLRLPANQALLNLTLNGQALTQPLRRGDQLVLSSKQQEKGAGEASLDVKTFRLYTDGLPPLLETELRLDITGPSREQVLGKVLPAGFEPVALQSDLPARFDADGALRVQLMPGVKRIRIGARAQALADSLTVRPDGVLPAQEVWSVAGQGKLRSLGFEGASPIDPSQTQMPGEWRQLPAFVITQDAPLRLVEQSRGRQMAANRLHLDRRLWLGFDGDSYHFADRLSGELRQDWRLDMAAPYQLQQAAEEGRPLPLTQNPSGQGTGIELRSSQLDLSASGELAQGGAWPVSGWSSPMESVSLALMLPPGYRLLAAVGAESNSTSWLGAWNLLDMFILVLTTALVYKLCGWRWAALILPALALLFHEPGMPYWLLLNATLAMLAYRELGQRFHRVAFWYQWLSLGALVLVLVPFAAAEVRALLHPQLEARIGSSVYEPNIERMEVTASRYEEAELADKAKAVAEEKREALARQSRLRSVSAPLVPPAPKAQAYLDNQVASTGPGLPDWQWHRYQLDWRNPVATDTTLRLWILPYWLRAPLLALALAGLLGWLAWQLKGRWQAHQGAALLLLMLLPLPKDAMAAMPDGALLAELKERLSRPPQCAPHCLALEEARLELGDQQWTLTLQTEAKAAASLPLPANWLPALVEVDGQRSLSLLENGQLQLPLVKGRHQVVLTGPVPAIDRLSLDFPLVPGKVQVTAQGWDATGLSGNHLVGSSLGLVRKAREQGPGFKTGQLAVSPYVRVVRSLHFGDRWSVDTLVQRMAPEADAFSVKVALLPGEQLQSNLPQEAGQVRLDFAPGQQQLRFTSLLARSDSLTLTAPPLVERVEIWRLLPSNLWRLALSGTPQIESDDGEDWQAQFAPRGGEQLRVDISQPQQLGGATLAFDGVMLSQQLGEGRSSATLALDYRASLGGKHALTLPDQWQLTRVSQDGDKLSLGVKDGTLLLPIQPGQHRLEMEFRSPQGISLLQGLPQLNLGLAAANIRVQLDLGPDRWLLYSHGPVNGPVVLYWSALLVFLVLALGLHRTGLLPVGVVDLLLLGLGLSTLSWGLLILVVAWLLAIGWRRRQEQILTQPWFNPVQVALMALGGLALLLLVLAVPYGLLSRPDMMLAGPGSSGLSWYQDLSDGSLPGLWLLNLPLWVYKGAMLLWAIWLSFALIRWVRLAWQALNVGGFWFTKVWGDEKPKGDS